MNNSISHDETVIEMIRSDKKFAETYLHTAFKELDEEGGEAVFLIALRHIVEARGGMADVSTRTGLSRESLYRALSPKGNPTIRTIKKVIHATGLSFGGKCSAHK